jgi:Icc-related predicted phosphoesterase
MLSAKPEFRKMTDKQKQQMTETLVIMSGITNAGYLKAIETEDEQLLIEAHKVAKESLEQLLGVSIDKIKFNLSGMHLK